MLQKGGMLPVSPKNGKMEDWLPSWTASSYGEELSSTKERGKLSPLESELDSEARQV